MKKKLLFGLLVVAGLVSFIIYTFVSTGFFREIKNTDGYEVVAQIPLYGAEDLTISYEDNFMVISQDDRGAGYEGRKRKGGLYLVRLDQPDFEPIRLRAGIPMLPHGINLYKMDSSRYLLFVVNHLKEHTIEKFELIGDSLTHLETYRDPAIVSPNDVVALDEDRFYFTNDHGYTSKFGLLLENYLGLAVSNVVFFDGSNFNEAADGIGYANGINISKDRSQLLVASPRKFKLKYYDILADCKLAFDHNLDVGSGIDNIEVDLEGNLWMGSHPNLLGFTAYSGGKKPIAPSEIIKVSGQDKVESLYENDGTLISASSVVAPYKDLLIVGTVMDKYVTVLRKR